MTSVPSSVPMPDYTSGLKNSSSAAIPLAENTRTDCYDYFWLDNTTSNPLADCWTLAITADTSEEARAERHFRLVQYPHFELAHPMNISKPTSAKASGSQTLSSVAASSTPATSTSSA
ncbi:hypothetical protein PENARI_c003G09797 [Penicillium arizonense]|uniref:Uncharacterized protein n=1 Tax=Penicillium arizonense TaxID=1835702 RepID=A0A1F5LT13_PENAI|nr:hypothetical protein PENARI_c003G09797 [Penicillium arizonense]OGE56001.1 hypothetical protein PENARI_c003G09797 [Penicillium arizonense]